MNVVVVSALPASWIWWCHDGVTPFGLSMMVVFVWLHIGLAAAMCLHGLLLFCDAAWEEDRGVCMLGFEAFSTCGTSLEV